MKHLNLRIETDSLLSISDEQIDDLFGPYFNGITKRYQIVDDGRYKFQKNLYDYPILSMDPLYIGDYNIGISRLYDNNGEKFIGYYARPETQSTLLQQFRKLPRNSKLIIFDDDIGYGIQIKRVKRILSKMNIEVVDIFTLYDNRGLANEVLDVRDFILGAKFGGLVVESDNVHIRVPYLYPYVNVLERCSIDKPIEFSLKVWEFNKSILNKNFHDISLLLCNTMIDLCKQKIEEGEL